MTIGVLALFVATSSQASLFDKLNDRSAPPSSPTESYAKCATEGSICSVAAAGQMIYGAGSTFTAPKSVSSNTECSNAVFTDPVPATPKDCWYRVLPSGVDPMPPLMAYTGPTIDLAMAAIVTVSAGTSELRVRPTSEIAPASADGAFRTSCEPVKMTKDDPIVFPGGTGKSHLHTFFGNTGVNASSTDASLRTTGNSSCRGGIANRSAYWVPTMIDTDTGAPIAPANIGVYYKNGNLPGNQVMQAIPDGLRMIAGNPMATAPRGPSSEFSYRWKCIGGPNNQNALYGSDIPRCDPGAEVWQEIMFPQCWDGKNLDSPDHKSHMSFGEVIYYDNGGANTAQRWQCPSTHPVSIPSITFNVVYKTPAKGTRSWRLASDSYDATKPGGWSSHADWFNGWKQDISDAWFKSCIKGMKDCHSHLLGDGREIY